jgi:hypothetical protein
MLRLDATTNVGERRPPYRSWSYDRVKDLGHLRRVPPVRGRLGLAHPVMWCEDSRTSSG